ncbi:hypothetical protein Tco_0500300 [Tanacetum coccineum]
MDKRKRFKLTLENFKDIFKICPRVQGQDFDALPTDEEIMSFLRELCHTREINSLNDVVVDQMHQPWRTFAALINRSLSGKLTRLDKLRLSRAQILWVTPPKKVRKFKKPASPQLNIVLVSPEEPMGKSKRVKRPAKKSTKALARGGNDEDDSNNEQDSSGEESDQENDRDDEEEVNDEFVKTPSTDFDDEDETKITDNVEGDEDEEMDYTTSQLYDDVDIRLNKSVDTDEGVIQKEGTDAEKINKTEVPVTSSSHSSDLAAKFLNFSDIPHTDAEIVSPMDVHIHHEVPSKQTPTLLTVPVAVITESSPIYSTVIPQSIPLVTDI